MPCDIGYRSVADAVIDDEQRTGAPAIDRALMEQLGVDDPVFLAWAQELDRQPLLEKALERALAEVAANGDVRIDNGALVTRGDNRRLVERWQLEVLRIVLELLDYECAMSGSGLEGEKHGASGVHEYVAIAFTAGGASIRFEHFASDDALAKEQRKFLALAQRLGIRVRIVRDKRAGQAIPPGTIHPHKHRGKA